MHQRDPAAAWRILSRTLPPHCRERAPSQRSRSHGACACGASRVIKAARSQKTRPPAGIGCAARGCVRTKGGGGTRGVGWIIRTLGGRNCITRPSGSPRRDLVNPNLGPLAFPLRGGLLDTSLLSFSRKKMKGSDSKPSIYRPGGLLCQHSIFFCEAPSSSCSSTTGVARGRWRRSRRRLPTRTRRRVLRPTKTREHLSAPHRRLRHPHRQQD